MAWTFQIARGQLLDPDGVQVAIVYAGAGTGVNNPDDEAIPDVGPIPEGIYDIGPAYTHPTCGPLSMELTPDPGNDMHGRSGFLMHGDNAAANHTASHGCIIVPRLVRMAVDNSDDRVLVVLP